MRLLKRRHYLEKENRLLVRPMNKERNSTRLLNLHLGGKVANFLPYIIGSNWEQLLEANCSELLPREQLGAIGPNELLRIAPAGAIGSKRIVPNCSCRTYWEQLLQTNCLELLPRDQLGAIGPNELLRIAPVGAIGSKRIAPNCSRGSNWE